MDFTASVVLMGCLLALADAEGLDHAATRALVGRGSVDVAI